MPRNRISAHVLAIFLVAAVCVAVVSTVYYRSLTVADAAVTPPAGADVATWHNDIGRTGQNLKEKQLTWSSVNSGTFGKLALLTLDGRVDAQPLYLSNVSIAGKVHNVLLVATEGDTVYAFDADTRALLWKKSVLLAGETTSDDHGCGQITPQIGITATPVVDRYHAPNGLIYLVGMSKDASGKYHQRLHILDLPTGAEMLGAPTEIKAQYPGTGDNHTGSTVIFDPGKYAERSALLLSKGMVFISFTSHCDSRPYTGWVMNYGAYNPVQISALNLTPNGSEGAVWMAGAGLAADSAGSIYFLDANGTFDTTLTNGFPAHGDYGNCFMKLATDSKLKLRVADYFATHDTISKSGADIDLGSGGVVLLPDVKDNSGNVHHLAVGAGKDSEIYVVNRDSLGKFNPSTNGNYQTLTNALPGGVWASPAYFNGAVYYAGVNDTLKAFPISNGKLANPSSSQSSNAFRYPGATPSISANGSANGIVWAIENSATAVLHAYRANDLSQELYNSNQAGTRDHFGAGNKFMVPTIVNGKVFAGTQTGVAIFGLLK